MSGSTVTLSVAPPTGFQGFSAYSNLDVIPSYLISDTAGNWEETYGVYTSSGATIARAAVPMSSSNAGAQVTAFTGTITVAVIDPATFVNGLIQGVATNFLYVTHNPGSAATNGANATGTVYYMPVFINQWFSSVTLYFNINSLAAGTSTSAIGLYNNLNGQPNTRLAQATGLITGNQGGGATGSNNSGSLTMPSPQPPGLYWVAFVTTTTALFLVASNQGALSTQSSGKAVMGAADFTTTTFNDVTFGWLQTSATLPTTATPATVNNTKSFIFGVKAAL